MKLWIIPLIILDSISSSEFTNLFFKDLSTHPVYKSNHIYRPLDAVTFRDSITYLQEMDYLLVNTNNTIVNLDIYTLAEIQRLPVPDILYPDHCLVDPISSEYSCHLFGYWSRIIALNADSSVNQLFVCHNDNRATYHNLAKLENQSQPESSCPSSSIISLFASDYHFYAADLSKGRTILRFQPSVSNNMPMAKKRRLISTPDSYWLQQNDYLQFVFVFESGNFVYFLFREVAEEDSSYCGVKGVKSRVSRISKDDNGGSEFRLKDSWTTFVKATIICFDDDTGNLDSSLRYIEAGFYDNERKFLYATFSSGRSAPHASAICQYSINAIDQALDGLYMNVNDPRTPIQKLETDCHDSKDDCRIRNAAKYQMKYSPIIPSTKRHFIRHNGEIWTHIQVLTIDRSSRQYDVIFVATSKNKIKKFYRKLTDNFLCYSETLSLSMDDNQLPAIRDMRIINAKKSPQLFLLVTVTNGVYKVGVEHCQVHLVESLCIDPFCYWEPGLGKCKSIFQLEVYKLRQLPLLTHCSDGSELLDPIWEQWTSWEIHKNGNSFCENRARFCKKEACTNIGTLIPNVEIEVRNCSLHSQWSMWSKWSACSSSCGPGTATRRRWCYENSAACVGDRIESRSCLIDNQCLKGVNSTTEMWSDWSKCSAECGDGIMTRSKPCSDPSDGDCKLFESMKCVNNRCREHSRYGMGDLGDGSDDSVYVAKCSGNVSGGEDLEVTIEYDTMSLNDTQDLVWDCWSEWTNCSAYCSGATSDDIQRQRTRRCRVDDSVSFQHLCLSRDRETKTCQEDNCLEAVMISTNEEKGFQLVYIILVGVASFAVTCLLVISGVCIYFHKQKSVTRLIDNNADLNTLRRRSTFMRESYSPIPHSPMMSSGYKLDQYYSEPFNYNSISRKLQRDNQSPTFMMPPMVSDNLPTYSINQGQF